MLHVATTTYTNVPGGLVHWTFDGNSNYNSASGDATVTISKAEAVITVTPYNVAYDGAAHTATFTAVGVETIPADLSGLMDVSLTTHTDAGTYSTDSWSFAGNGNYNASGATITDVISKTDATISVIGFTGVYDGNAHGATGTATGISAEDLSSLLHVATTTYINVPGGLVHWTFDGNSNYNSASGDATVTISKADAVITVTPYNVAYDGAAHTATFTAVGVETIPADLSGLMDVSLTTHTAAGTYNGDAWSFAGNINYNSANGTVDDVIGKIDATISVIGFTGVYDGNAHGATGTATGISAEDLSSLLHVATTTYTNVPGGLVHWTFDGKANYNSASGDATVTISKADAVITVTPYNVAYDGAAHTATFTAIGVETIPADLTGLMMSA